MTTKNKLTFNMRYNAIKVIKYSQYDLEKDFKIDITPLIQFQSNFQFKVIDKEETLACLVTVKILIIETQEEFAEIKVENFFGIKPFKDMIKEIEPGKFNIPDELIVNLSSISASTVRGILSEKLKGTFIQNEIYPLIDPSAFLKNNKKNT